MFQHEIDHLDGVLYIDRLTAPEKIWEVQTGTEEMVEAEMQSAEAVPI
ncbi:MAG: peptide deformylase [Anaerolineae bacterium]|nr:peptide deformylase [Anaerolineae bacterium]